MIGSWNVGNLLKNIKLAFKDSDYTFIENLQCVGDIIRHRWRLFLKGYDPDTVYDLDVYLVNALYILFKEFAKNDIGCLYDYEHHYTLTEAKSKQILKEIITGLDYLRNCDVQIAGWNTDSEVLYHKSSDTFQLIGKYLPQLWVV